MEQQQQQEQQQQKEQEQQQEQRDIMEYQLVPRADGKLVPNVQYRDYLHRPRDLLMSYRRYISAFLKVKGCSKVSAKQLGAEHPQCDTHHIDARQREAVPVVEGPPLPNRNLLHAYEDEVAL